MRSKKAVRLMMTVPIMGLVGAADKEPQRAALLESLVDCSKIADRDQRLACYDTEVPKFDKAERDRQISVVDKRQVNEAKRSLFGFQLPRIRLFGDGKDDVSTVTSTIASIGSANGGGVSFTTADGATWAQVDDVMVAGRVAPGTQVVIQRGALGSYVASIGKRPGIRVRRVN